jgi:hypothetical protein
MAAGCWAGLVTLRRCEREADAHAALKLGRMWHRVLKELLYRDPTPLDLLVYGTREARLLRVLRIAEQTENAGYAPGGGT